MSMLSAQCDELHTLADAGNVDAERDAAFANALRRILEKHSLDIEISHIQADELLCDLLLSHGYVKTVNEFKSMRKWYG